MKAYLARLSSMERRFVVGVIVVLVLVFNVVFVWPRFKDWEEAQTRLFKARRTLATYQAEFSRTNLYTSEVKRLESAGQSAVPPEDQVIEFLRTIQTQAAQSHVNIPNYGRASEGTNQFFLEKSQTITIQADEAQLVDFLYNLGTGGSLIRARGLSVRPDAPRYQLNGNITLVASYQKKTTVRSAPASTGPAAAKSAAPAVKPSTPTKK